MILCANQKILVSIIFLIILLLIPNNLEFLSFKKVHKINWIFPSPIFIARSNLINNKIQNLLLIILINSKFDSANNNASEIGTFKNWLYVDNFRVKIFVFCDWWSWILQYHHKNRKVHFTTSSIFYTEKKTLINKNIKKKLKNLSDLLDNQWEGEKWIYRVACFFTVEDDWLLVLLLDIIEKVENMKLSLMI